ncbi:MAG: alpha-galactosidase [Lachnospiraceae bacterium]|nr:alpha-galactosidase [Lachnospiraceae bacterium]
MSILFSEDQKTVHIRNASVSYVMEVVDGKYLVHRYFGKAIRAYRGCGEPHYFKRGYNTEHDCSIPNVSFDDFPFEYPIRGNGDFRIPAFAVTQESGVEFTELSFRSWKVLKGKPEIPKLPATFAGKAEAETLEIICEDPAAGIRVYLYYSVFEEKGIIARHQRVENTGNQIVSLQNVQSLSLELPARDYDFLSLYGTHAKEGNISRFSIHHGIQRIESVRGSSSPQHQPFFALMQPQTTENSGEVYGIHFIYSGNFLAQAEADQFGNVRAQIGIHPDTFCWRLAPGEVFDTPEAILNYSSQGLNGMSRNFHWLYQYHLMPDRFQGRNRPILLNSWEAMYYDVNLEKLEEQAELAKKLGVELFVLDDGWFRADNTSRTSMGDWKCNEKKLPGGIQKAAELIHGKGLQFGLWFEPEAICKSSELYQQHPDWALQVPGYQMTEGRHEYLLDLSRQEVREYLLSVLDFYLKDGTIDYVKWDMNRPLTDVNSMSLVREKKGEISHRYVLGLYEILERMTRKYPQVLIEGCSSGGARFDPGMLYYVAQNWASDNTDAFDRVQIQSGFSLIYPPIAIGSHVSITPNHQTGRSTSLNTRYQVSRLFNLGYELDLTKCTEEERSEIAGQIAEHKKERSWLQKAEFYRNETPNENYVSWLSTGKDKEECLVLIFQKFFNPLYAHGRFCLNGLNPECDYLETFSGKIYGGDELMEIGVSVPLIKEDFHVFTFHFVRESHREQSEKWY